MVHTVTSSHGGVFSVIIDGVNTTSTIDTYSDDQLMLPQCMPSQFPPVLIPPPTLANNTEHTITLVHIGTSPNAGNKAYEPDIQFDSFALPNFLVDGQNSTSGAEFLHAKSASVVLICSYIVGTMTALFL
jgi:hypothetical protein